MVENALVGCPREIKDLRYRDKNLYGMKISGNLSHISDIHNFSHFFLYN